MTAKLLSGIACRDDLFERIKKKYAVLKKELEKLPHKEFHVAPGLATVLVGDDGASQVYVKNKRSCAAKLGFQDFHYHLSSSVTEQKLLELIDELNRNTEVHGILVQLPLPSHINEKKVLEMLHTKKDVDGFHSSNMGSMLISSTTARLVPCTPAGVMHLLYYYKISPYGKHVVVVGRSNIVGKPMAAMMMQKYAKAENIDNVLAGDATVTICHSSTSNLRQYTAQADIVIMAAGRPRMLTSDMLKPGVVVIDVGIHKITENGKTFLVGDVDFNDVKEGASAITPVPGGVGPMTIGLLMKNTFLAYSQQMEELFSKISPVGKKPNELESLNRFYEEEEI